ncbi:MAG: DUF302 domain-containing protein [Bacteroidetes bacterium]|nr:DUF302 domain-containing protein [Bacteroidota bacterium]
MATIPVSMDNPLGQFTYQISSTKPVNEVVARIGAACELHKFSVLHSYDFREILAGKGFPIERKVHVFEICRAPMAAKMLTANPSFAVFMPCRIAVYEENGKTILSTMNMELVMESIKHNKELYTEAAVIYQSIQEMMRFLAA